MKAIRYSVLALSLLASAGATSAACMEEANDLPALIQCAKSEVVPVETKVEAAFARVLGRYSGNSELVKSLQASKKSWDAYRDSQCALEGRARASGGGPEASLELQRGIMICVRRAFEQRLAELNAL